MNLQHHHPDTGLPSADNNANEEDVLREPAISWPASQGGKRGEPMEQPGWHHGFEPQGCEDEINIKFYDGPSPRQCMGSSGPKGKFVGAHAHPAFHIPEEGDLNPGNQPPTSWD